MEPYTQTCFVARDLERAISQWTAIGAGPFYLVDVSLLPPDRLYRGAIAKDVTLVARGFLGTTQIEIATPANDEPSIFQEVLVTRGEGLHHVMPSVQPTTPAQFDALSAKYEAMGLERCYSMVVPWIGRVAYFDGFATLGYFIELTERSEEMHAAAIEMYKTHLSWDGSDPIRR